MSNDKKTTPADSAPGRFAYDGLDRVIHEKARLGILTSLAAHPKGLSFNDLKQLCSLTDGNLSRHLQILVDAKLVTVEKGQKDNRPHTQCKISALGRRRLTDYVAVLETVLADAGGAARAALSKAGDVEGRRSAATRPGFSQG